MTKEFWVVYGVADGNIRWRGSGAPGEAAIQQVEEGLAVLEVPQSALSGSDVDLESVAAFHALRVAAAAEAQRQPFITAAPGKVMEYIAKNAEALALIANPQAPTPFLSAEAAAIGVSVATLATEVRTAALAWQAAGAKIGAAERKAKLDIAAATNVGAIAEAANVDWVAVLAP